MTEIKTNSPGHVMVADEAIAVIAGTAALEVDGVAGLAGHFTTDIAEILGRKQMGKGITVSVEGEQVRVTADITVKSGTKIQEVCCEVQQKIKMAIETMTGLTVAEVNVSVGALAGVGKRGA